MAPTIAIVGAGPAGLTLARLLQVSDVPAAVTVFEKDTSPTARVFQGGTLDLHPDTGIAALKEAGLWETARPHMRYDGDELVVADKNATEFVHMKEPAEIEGSGARPEVDRETLKQLLLESVPAGWIKWGKHLRRVDGETGLLTFDDGETAGPFDLVVGADGAWSKVRPVLTDVQPRYSGICGLVGHIATPSTDYPKLSKMVGRGSYFAFPDCKSIMAQRLGDDRITISTWVMREESYPADLLAMYGGDEEKLKQKILEPFEDWAPEIKEWVMASTVFRPWPLYELPVGHRWKHRKAFTLIGDSASLMTPVAGEGVNKALRDSLELAAAIIERLKSDGGPDLDAAVQKYEEIMFPRAEKVQQETKLNKETEFRPDAPVGFMAAMVEAFAEETGYNLNKGVLAWIPVTKMAYCFFWSLSTFSWWRRRLTSWVWGR